MITYQMIASETKRKKESQDCVELQATLLSKSLFFFYLWGWWQHNSIISWTCGSARKRERERHCQSTWNNKSKHLKEFIHFETHANMGILGSSFGELAATLHPLPWVKKINNCFLFFFFFGGVLNPHTKLLLWVPSLTRVRDSRRQCLFF